MWEFPRNTWNGQRNFHTHVYVLQSYGSIW